MKTHYDTLGIVPAADANAVNEAFINAVKAELEDGDFKSSMWWNPRHTRIVELTEAHRVLIHSDRRKVYNVWLIRMGAVCGLCEGRGRNRLDLVQRTCMACNGSGKGLVVA